MTPKPTSPVTSTGAGDEMIQANSIASEKVCDHPSTEKAANELNACPFCQSEFGPVVYTVENWNGERVTSEVSCVECEACGAKGPEAVGPKAVEAWNRAAPPAGQVIAHPANSLRSLPESSEPSLLGRETVREALDIAAKDLEWIATGGAESVDGNYRSFAHKALERVRRALSPLKE